MGGPLQAKTPLVALPDAGAQPQPLLADLAVQRANCGVQAASRKDAPKLLQADGQSRSHGALQRLEARFARPRPGAR